MDDATTKPMSADAKETWHRDAEARIETFRYQKLPGERPVKEIVNLFKSDLIRLNVQVVKEGGENNLHYHTGGDNCWMVIRGAARFYGVGDKLLGEFRANEGILLPGGTRYWFEKIGCEDLEILQIVCREARNARTARINLERHKDWMTDAALQVYEEAPQE